MTINILNTSSIEYSYVNMLVYGYSGAGKTMLASTCESPLVLSAESGLLSISNMDIDYININNFNEFIEAFNFINKSEDAKKYKTIFIDSLSEIAECILVDEKGKVKDGRQAYMAMQERIFKVVRKFRDIQHHVVMTSKVERAQDEQQRMMHMPSMPGNKVSQSLPYFFDEVFALRVDREADGDNPKTVRMLQTDTDAGWAAKDRSGKLNLYEEPNIINLIDKMLDKSKSD